MLIKLRYDYLVGKPYKLVLNREDLRIILILLIIVIKSDRPKKIHTKYIQVFNYNRAIQQFNL